MLPERCIVVAHVTGALSAGAVVRARERVLEWDDSGSGVRVDHDRRVVEADRLVLTPAPGRRRSRASPRVWCEECARRSPAPARAAGLFEPTASRSSTSRSTATISAAPASGSPASNSGYDHFGEGGARRDPREPTLDDETPLRAFAERYFPEGAGPAIAVKTCLFEPSPDEHFLIDRHPDAPHAVLGAGFSGTASSSAPSSARSSPTSRSTALAARHQLRLDRFG